MTTRWNSSPFLPTKWLQASSETMSLVMGIALLGYNDSCFCNVKKCLDSWFYLFYYSKISMNTLPCWSMVFVVIQICVTWPWFLRVNDSYSLLLKIYILYWHFMQNTTWFQCKLMEYQTKDHKRSCHCKYFNIFIPTLFFCIRHDISPAQLSNLTKVTID